MNIHIILHESFEAPGAIIDWATDHGHTLSYTRLYDGDSLPKTTDNFDMLIVMGGPQTPATTPQECAHYDGPKEVAYVRQVIADNKLVFGVCLGAQIIGEACGGLSETSPEREIGVFPVTLPEAGKNDPLFEGFPETFETGHWHGDMPGLTPEAEVLAESEGCPRQIVRYTPKAYAFQCHMEFTPEAIEGMIEASTEELETNKDLPFVETPEQLRAHEYAPMNKLLFQFLDNFTNTT